MASIYEMRDEFKTLWALVDDDTIDADAVQDAFNVAIDDLSEKLEGYCKFIKNLDNTIAGLKEEEERLRARRKRLESAKEHAKTAMRDVMNEAGEKKIECGTFTVSVQKNPPHLVYDEGYIENIPVRYLIPQEPKIDTKVLIEDLKSGENIEELDGIAHLEYGESIRIR